MNRGSTACPAMPPWALIHFTMAVAWARASPGLSGPLMPAAWLSGVWWVATKRPMRTVVGVTPRGGGRRAVAAWAAAPGAVPAWSAAAPVAAAPAPGPSVEDGPRPAAPVAPGAADD